MRNKKIFLLITMILFPFSGCVDKQAYYDFSQVEWTPIHTVFQSGAFVVWKDDLTNHEYKAISMSHFQFVSFQNDELDYPSNLAEKTAFYDTTYQAIQFYDPVQTNTPLFISSIKITIKYQTSDYYLGDKMFFAYAKTHGVINPVPSYLPTSYGGNDLSPKEFVTFCRVNSICTNAAIQNESDEMQWTIEIPFQLYPRGHEESSVSQYAQDGLQIAISGIPYAHLLTSIDEVYVKVVSDYFVV